MAKYLFKSNDFMYKYIDMAVIHDMYKNLHDYLLLNQDCGIDNITLICRIDCIFFYVSFKLKALDDFKISVDKMYDTSAELRKYKIDHAAKFLEFYNKFGFEKIELFKKEEDKKWTYKS